MTGPAHYREAEKLIAAANRRISADDSKWLQTPSRRAELRDEAAIHATLFLGAATVAAEALKCGLMTIDEFGAWAEATGIKAPGTSAPRAGEKE